MRTKIRWAVVTLAMVASSSALAQGVVADREKQIDAYLTKARDVLDSKLFDYPATRFKDVQAATAGESVFLCGYMNSKNLQGAYVGWTQFLIFGNLKSTFLMSMPRTDSLDMSEEEIRAEAAIKTICKPDGMENEGFNDGYVSPRPRTDQLVSPR